MPPPSNLVTGRKTGDILLGFLGSVASVFVGIGIIAAPILYFVLRERYPVLSRSLGYGWLAVMLLLLNPLVICAGIALIAHLQQNGRFP